MGRNFAVLRSMKPSEILGRGFCYITLISWSLVTILPLFWMTYSSFKSNEELTRDIYAFPKDLLQNTDDEYIIIAPQLNIVPNYDIENDKRERIIIESTSIAPGRRLMIHFLVKEDLPNEIASLQIGDKIILSQLPLKMQRKISWNTVWFNYSSAFIRGEFGLKFLNSILYTVASTFFIVLFGLMIAFALNKLPFKRMSKIIMAVVGLGYLISLQSLLIPLFLMLSALNLTDTHLGIILVYTAFGLPLSVLLSTQFIKDIPDSLIESASMDGASLLRIFWNIIVPMCTPVIITISIISALSIWNEFLLVLVLASSNITKSLPVGVYSFSSLTSTELGWQLAALVIATAPAIVIYLFFQKRLTQGVMGGALKG